MAISSEVLGELWQVANSQMNQSPYLDQSQIMQQVRLQNAYAEMVGIQKQAIWDAHGYPGKIPEFNEVLLLLEDV